MSATWLICVPTVPARAAKLERLLTLLLPQTEAFSGRVKVLAWLNVGVPRLAEIRDAMVEQAAEEAWEYVSFLDDDDLIATDFVHAIYTEAMERRRPDHVGFWLDYYRDGQRMGRVQHSLKWPRWATLKVPEGRTEEYPRGYRLVRDFTHIDPIRTEIAQWGRFSKARPGEAEDRVWCQQLRERLARHLSSTEVFIDRSLYTYLWVPAESVWDNRGHLAERGIGARPSNTHPNLMWHKESL
jgi:hypothetical protein